MSQIFIRGNEIATKEYVDSLSLGGDGSVLDNYYTKEEVNELIEENSSTGGDANLTNYYTKEEINNIISETNNSTQVEEMPEPSGDNKGTIVQYIGVTNENYTTSNFYQVVEQTIINEDGSETTIYVWEEILTPEINLDGYATKNYVDGSLNNLTIGNAPTYVIHKTNTTHWYPNGEYPNNSYNIGNGPEVQAILQEIYDAGYDSFNLIMIESGYSYFFTYKSKKIQDKPTSIQLESYHMGTNGVDMPIITVMTIMAQWPDGIATVSGVRVVSKKIVSRLDTQYLNKTNTSSFTPTGDYHPATKKYVDDTIATSIAEMSTTSMDVTTSLPTENISTSTIYLIKDETASTDSENIYNEYIYINGK